MKNMLCIILIVALAIVIYWSFRKGHFPGMAAFILALLGVIFGSNRKLKEKEKEVEAIIHDLQEKEKEIKELREAHDKEVKEIDEADYSDMSIDDLIAHANERERKRGPDTDN